ncbi:MAG: alanine:cation symporter family protein, partial [Bilophila sp.]
LCLALFAFTTTLGWCVYGERCAIYLMGDKAQIPFRVIYSIAVPIGVLAQLDVVWLIADTCNALMAIPNLIAILLLSPMIFKLVREEAAKDPNFKA